jgi:coiled-coil domain-containing protein 130
LLNEKAAANEAILERTGLSITLLDESPTDAIRAKLITFGPDHAEEKIKYAHSKPLFEKPEPGRRRKCQESSSLETGKLKSQQAIEKTKEAFHKDLLRNTRAAVDPFLEVNRHDRPPRPSLGIKYNKRKAQEITEECEDEDRAHQEQDKCGTEPAVKSMVAMSLGLDDYSSE